ncbi:MAG: PorT family protein [Ignavibacteriales bacterium]|nr:PorT family protein [Ignavibacteriales bacterium]
MKDVKIKFILASIFVFVFLLDLNAQIKIRVKGGLNFGTATLNPEPVGLDIEHRIATVVGIGIEYSLENIAVQFEILYSMKGTIIEYERILGSYSPIKEKITSKVDYLEIPLSLKYYIPIEGSIIPFIFTGASISFLISSKEITETEESTKETDMKDYTNNTDFGIIVGAGTNINLGSGIIVIDARYNFGVTDINNWSLRIFETKLQTIQLCIGYYFNL